MHDLHCKKADEMHSPILAKRMYELKGDTERLNLCAMKWRKSIVKEWKAERNVVS